jgi:hypothetical protein
MTQEYIALAVDIAEDLEIRGIATIIIKEAIVKRLVRLGCPTLRAFWVADRVVFNW